jgi:hypothetical protein
MSALDFPILTVIIAIEHADASAMHSGLLQKEGR